MARVSVLRSDGSISNYTTYDDASDNSTTGELIIIWTDLDSEQILLKDGVDIWIMDGVEILFSDDPVIIDGGIAVTCRIYGNGKIRNNLFSCIELTNPGTKLKIGCDTIVGGLNTIDVQAATQFYLKCNSILSSKTALVLGIVGTNDTAISDVNIQVKKIETSTASTSTTAVVSRSFGFFEIDEIKCNKVGHCFSHREGVATAIIRRMETTNTETSETATLHVSATGPQGTGDQTLVLYFDEILANATGEEVYSGSAIEAGGGYMYAVGRMVYSSHNYAMSCGLLLKTGYFNIINFISEATKDYYPLNIANYEGDVLINSKFIEGKYSPNSGNSLVVSLNGSSLIIPKCTIKNAYLINNGTSLTQGVYGIYLDSTYVDLAINNLKIISRDEVVISPGGSMSINNYGLYGNENINNITLQIGTGVNDLFIVDPDLEN